MVNEQKEENRIKNHRPLTVYRPLEGEDVITKVFTGLKIHISDTSNKHISTYK